MRSEQWLTEGRRQPSLQRSSKHWPWRMVRPCSSHWESLRGSEPLYWGSRGKSQGIQGRRKQAQTGSLRRQGGEPEQEEVGKVCLESPGGWKGSDLCGEQSGSWGRAGKAKGSLGSGGKRQNFVYVVVVLSLSCVQLFVTPGPAARQASLSLTISQRLPSSCPLSR